MKNNHSKLLYAAVLAIIVLQLITLRTNNNPIVNEITKIYYNQMPKKENEFSKENLIAYIKQLNIKYPNVVLAQARIESGNFKSKLFKESNNLFGMRIAKGRPTTAQEGRNNYAKYNNWKESVLDYALMQARYYNNCKTESEYLAQIQKNYCEENNYIDLLKQCMK